MWVFFIRTMKGNSSRDSTRNATRRREVERKIQNANLSTSKISELGFEVEVPGTAR